MSSQDQFDNVWTALTDTPEQAFIMTLRSDIMADICAFIKDRRLTQSEAAELLGINQPRVSDLLRGKLSKFNVESLLELQQRCGRTFEWTFSNAA